MFSQFLQHAIAVSAVLFNLFAVFGPRHRRGPKTFQELRQRSFLGARLTRFNIVPDQHEAGVHIVFQCDSRLRGIVVCWVALRSQLVVEH